MVGVMLVMVDLPFAVCELLMVGVGLVDGWGNV